jgi:anti-sigma regulatory factor (Ser/Thr protein kinase)
MKTARTFPPDPESITAARRFVLAAMGAAPRDLRDVVSVMVSELAMNAVQHARTPFEVTVEVTGPTLRVEVTDSGGGTAEAQPPPPATSLHGRGLFIVDQLSDAWGVNPTALGPSKSVWFTIALTAAADSSPGQSAVTDLVASAWPGPAGGGVDAAGDLGGGAQVGDGVAGNEGPAPFPVLRGPVLRQVRVGVGGRQRCRGVVLRPGPADLDCVRRSS